MHTTISEGSFLGENCVLGDYCFIGHPTKHETTGDMSLESEKTKEFIVEGGVHIGDNAVIRSHCVIYKNVRAGKNLRTGHGCVIREHTTIGDGVTIGTGAVIDGYVKIGSRSQIQSKCYIAQTVRIGKGVFIAPCVSFYDNKKIILNVSSDLNGATVDDYVRIGGGSVILPGVHIGRGALIGAGSVVTKNVPERAVVFGNPAKIVRYLTEDEEKQYIESVGR